MKITFLLPCRNFSGGIRCGTRMSSELLHHGHDVRILYRAGSFNIKAVDSTGAGDVFHGAFIYGMLAGLPIEEILRFANATAAMKCGSLGGQQGIPTLKEVIEFIECNSR